MVMVGFRLGALTPAQWTALTGTQFPVFNTAPAPVLVGEMQDANAPMVKESLGGLASKQRLSMLGKVGALCMRN